ncbi:MAG: hypothetical protein U0516_00920 [Candidatus Saccharibacteria bacterium]
MRNSLTKISVLLVGILTYGFVSLSIPSIALAQEINPAAGTYSYGSTSEFSPYVALTSSSTLAPTGADQYVGYIAIGILLLTASGIFVYAIKNRRQYIRAN